MSKQRIVRIIIGVIILLYLLFQIFIANSWYYGVYHCSIFILPEFLVLIGYGLLVWKYHGSYKPVYTLVGGLLLIGTILFFLFAPKYSMSGAYNQILIANPDAYGVAVNESYATKEISGLKNPFIDKGYVFQYATDFDHQDEIHTVVISPVTGKIVSEY